MMEREKEIECLICGAKNINAFFYPPTRFNNKLFSYYKCEVCHSAFINPTPDSSDFDLIYGTEDHTYLKKLQPREKLKFSYNYPEFNHQGFQIKFFEKYNYAQPGKTLLDIGCGSGFYMNYAQTKGMKAVGVEYNAEFAGLLREKTDLEIFSFSEFEQRFKDQKFDMIHAGHILEHLVQPSEMMDFIKKYAHSDTIVIVDGPLENNFHFAGLVIKIISKIKGKKENNYAPQHITFTNAQSQIGFFERNGLVTDKFDVVEQFHPLPNTLNLKNPFQTLLFFLGLFSINFSMLNKKWGNVFHYAGRVKK